MAPRRLSHTSDTAYPKLDLEDLQCEQGDGDEDDSIDDELRHDQTRQQQRGNDGKTASKLSKEDDDVRMFLALVDQMSLPSMLFLLQNHAREMLHTIPQQELQQVLDVVNNNGRTNSGRIVLSAGDLELLSRPEPIKQFRFAEIMGGSQIRVQVFDHLHVNDITETEKAAAWWSEEAMKKMKRNAAKVVRHFKQYRTHAIQTIKRLAILGATPPSSASCSSSSSSSTASSSSSSCSSPPSCSSYALERLIKDFAKEGEISRGLEVHISSFVKDMRYRSIEAVLDLQDLVYDAREITREEQHHHTSGADDDVDGIPAEDIARDWESIRAVYVRANKASARLAYHYAQADQMQAFQAVLSKWTAVAGTMNSTMTIESVVPEDFSEEEDEEEKTPPSSFVTPTTICRPLDLRWRAS